jgi:hypothetical protein
MMSLVAVGVLILPALSIVCFAAYKIRAKSFEVSTSVGKIAAFSIRIISADAEDCESARDRIESADMTASSDSSSYWVCPSPAVVRIPAEGETVRCYALRRKASTASTRR